MFTGGRGAADGGNGETSGAGLGVLTASLAADDHVDAGAQAPVIAAVEPDRPSGPWLRRYQGVLVGVDVVAAGIAGAVAFLLRFVVPDGPVSKPLYAAVCIALPAGWVAVVAFNRAYEGRFVGVGAAEFERIFRSFLHLTALLAIAFYATRADVARGFVLIALPLTLGLDVLGRYGARKWLHRQRTQGRAMRAVLAVGDATAVAGFTRVLQRDRHAGMNVVGACLCGSADAEDVAELRQLGVPQLGDVDSVVESAQGIGANTVAVVSSGSVGPEKLRWISWQLEGTDVELIVSPGLTEVAGPRLHIQPVAGLPLLHVEQPEFKGFRRFLKGAFDRSAALVAVVMLSPIFLAVWLAIRLTSSGPALFRQTRIGRDGTPFTMLKFRSMYVDAESRLGELQARNINSDGLLFKMRDDPRITRVGKVLRKFSLDELPQLINVLRGEMSLVGPRPPLPVEVDRYGEDVRRRLLVKPGLTGLWQVSGRSDLSWEESVRLDLRYVENWSPALDLLIVWKTFFAVLGRHGAY